MSLRSRIALATKTATNILLGREERNVPAPSETIYHSYGMPALFRPAESIDAYGDNPWLGGAVDRIVQTLARTKFHLQKGFGDDIEIIHQHQALETLRKPQPTKAGKSLLSSMDLKLVTGYHLCLNGEAFWILDKRLKIGGAPTFIDMLIPQYVHVRIEHGELIEYIYRIDGHELHFDPQDIVHFKLPDPKHWQRGTPPIKSLRWSIDTHREADIMNLRKIQNGAIPGGTLETEQAVPDAEREKILNQWNERHGGAENAGKTAVLPRGLHFNKTQESNQDMQFVEGKKLTREEILARYGVGPELLGLTDSQTRANAEAAIYIFMMFGASFFIDKFADTLTNDYLPAFPGTDGMEVGNPDPVPENMEEKRSNAQTLFDMGALSPNAALKMFGMETIDAEGMDSTYMDINKVPVGEPPPSLAL